jgi:hypothetical protein
MTVLGGGQDGLATRLIVKEWLRRRDYSGTYRRWSGVNYPTW